MNWIDFFAGVGVASVAVYAWGIIRARGKDRDDNGDG